MEHVIPFYAQIGGFPSETNTTIWNFVVFRIQFESDASPACLVPVLVPKSRDSGRLSQVKLSGVLLNIALLTGKFQLFQPDNIQHKGSTLFIQQKIPVGDFSFVCCV